MNPLTCGSPIAREAFVELRRRMMFEFCKWDPQVEDVSSLAPFPLLLAEEEWCKLARWSQQLADETLAAEAELLHRPDLAAQLGLPRLLVRLLRRSQGLPPALSAPRIMRFDFHWTTQGWRISEVNSDVPGGFIEASPFTRLIAELTASASKNAIPAGDPAEIYVEALAELAHQHPAPVAGMVHATAFSDDRQVMTYLARRLADHGVRAVLVSPQDLHWESDRALLQCGSEAIPADLLVRFYPGEWLPELPARAGWKYFFVGAKTPLSNPASALLTQSKRFPLVWDKLATPLPTWRELLPETCDPRRVPWKRDESWVLKPALGRVGDSIGLRGVASPREWNTIRRSASWFPSHWAAQHRFEMEPVAGPQGPLYPVIGVYTVDRVVAGVYARIAPRPLIDHRAQDVALLIPQPQPSFALPAVMGGAARSRVG